MYHSSTFKTVPDKPGIYALYDGFRGNKCVYVGKSGKLKTRIRDHLILRISTVTSGTSGASINVENLTRLKWWTNDCFEDADYLDAAETLAFKFLNPVLSSRGGRLKSGKKFLKDSEFVDEVSGILENPGGEIELLSYSKLYEKVIDMEERLSALENRD